MTVRKGKLFSCREPVQSVEVAQGYYRGAMIVFQPSIFLQRGEGQGFQCPTTSRCFRKEVVEREPFENITFDVSPLAVVRR